MGERKTWTVEEDEICCKVCVDLYVVKKETMDIEECLEEIEKHHEMQGRDRSSIRMRVQNIKALFRELDVPNTLDIQPLNNAAKQTRDVLEKYLENKDVKTEKNYKRLYSMLTLEEFKNFLKEKGYSEYTDSGKPSTVYDYSMRIDKICARENFKSLDDLAKNIEVVVKKYDKGGSEWYFGQGSHNAYINALRRFSEFVKTRKEC